ncbi:DUF1295 domain-containing protein [Sandaracinobacteroides saxicola]|uniref:DUF1295 domain-containing protein n=1 Tax=Sandaracinobacteroides saxicola TaxID=2759707 RepID=A0A7G5IH41_9SPHN|nr:DUF1295 domain-containing protein [Sandaracinobacteroides saxicola]QMW22683.1 DUF1295 domain-containing protein [Sandaracinobacteroides saxicola]
MTGFLLTNAAVAAMLFALLWLVNLRTRDPSFIDAFWALGMVAMAVSSFLQTEVLSPRNWLLTWLCALWGLRLGTHLLARWRVEGMDPRYRAIVGTTMERRGWGFGLTTLLQLFGLQAVLMFLVSLPVQLGQYQAYAPIGVLGWAGVALFALGFLFETVGDAQLARFKRDPANAGKVMDRGLWRFTRHPNYFGDFCVWWGLWLIACGAPWGWVSVVGPLFLSFTLMRWSGVPMLERKLKRSRPGYAAYAARTNAFFPGLPKG